MPLITRVNKKALIPCISARDESHCFRGTTLIGKSYPLQACLMPLPVTADNPFKPTTLPQSGWIRHDCSRASLHSGYALFSTIQQLSVGNLSGAYSLSLHLTNFFQITKKTIPCQSDLYHHLIKLLPELHPTPGRVWAGKHNGIHPLLYP